MKNNNLEIGMTLDHRESEHYLYNELLKDFMIVTDSRKARALVKFTDCVEITKDEYFERLSPLWTI